MWYSYSYMITSSVGKKNQVFLGGTCGENNWRENFIEKLTKMGVDKHKLFNPIVSNWDEEAQKKEDQAKEESKYLLFYIANPNTKGNEVSAYSLIELTMNLYDNPDSTIAVLDDSELSPDVSKALNKGFRDLKKRFPKSNIFSNIDEAMIFLSKSLK